MEECLANFNWERFAIDTETTSLNITELKLLGISLCDGEHNYYIVTQYKGQVILDAHEVCKKVHTCIQKVSKLIIAHNMVYDYLVLKKYDLDLEPYEWYDTMVADHLLDENRRHGLKFLTEVYLNKKATTFKSDNEITMQAFAEYALDDTLHTWQIAVLQRGQLKEQDLDFLFRKIEMPFLRSLANMQETGVLIDKNKLLSATATLEKEIIKHQELLYKELGESYNIQYDLLGNVTRIEGKYNFNSSQQLGDLIFKKLKLPVIEQTESGKPSTGSSTLRALADKHPFVAALRKYKGMQKLHSSFFKPLPELMDNDGRVRTNFHDTGTVTGRLSSSKPNLQQLPKNDESIPVDFRACFISSPGKKMIAVDYSQQELRVMAQLTKDPTILKSFKDGLDLHLYIANKVLDLGIPEEKLYENHREYREIKDTYKKQRDKGKVFSFGIPYGMGAQGMAQRLGVQSDEAQHLLDKYYEEFPNVKRSMASVQRQAERDGFVSTYTKRRRHFSTNEYGKLDSRSVRQSFNFLIQSFGADLIRVACNKLYSYRNKHPEMGINILMTVHDEIVFECNEEYASKLKRYSEKVLESCGKLQVPLLAEASIGMNYSEAK